MLGDTSPHRKHSKSDFKMASYSCFDLGNCKAAERQARRVSAVRSSFRGEISRHAGSLTRLYLSSLIIRMTSSSERKKPASGRKEL